MNTAYYRKHIVTHNEVNNNLMKKGKYFDYTLKPGQYWLFFKDLTIHQDFTLTKPVSAFWEVDDQIEGERQSI